MASKPILFSTPMVQAILEGRKTVTRRVIKPQPTGYFEVNDSPCYLYDFSDREGRVYPRYQVGDILYVREAYADLLFHYVYKADYRGQDLTLEELDLLSDVKWKPSIHMPKEIARIFLKVTNVRVERLRDITETQVRKEGFRDYLAADDTFYPSGYYFRQTWDGTIKKQDLDKYSWEANPWVWVIEFERTEKP